MTQPRVDLYAIIHKAVRSLLYDTATMLGRADFSRAAGRDAALADVERSLGFITEHLGHEDSHIQPVLRRLDPAAFGMRVAIQSSIPPQCFAVWLSMMFPAMNIHEQVGVLTGMKAGAPQPVYEQTCALITQALGDRWAAVEAALA